MEGCKGMNTEQGRECSEAIDWVRRRVSLFQGAVAQWHRRYIDANSCCSRFRKTHMATKQIPITCWIYILVLVYVWTVRITQDGINKSLKYCLVKKYIKMRTKYGLLKQCIIVNLYFLEVIQKTNSSILIWMKNVHF